MSIRQFHAQDFLPDTRLDQWREVVSTWICPMDLSYDGLPTGRLTVGRLGPVRVTELSDGPGQARRTADHIRRSPVDRYLVLLQMDGHTAAGEGGGRVDIAPGQFGVCETSRPYQCTFSERRAVCVSFPKPMLPLADHEMERLASTPFSGEDGISALVAAQMARLPACLEHAADPFVAARLNAALADTLTLALTTRLGRREAGSRESRERSLLSRVHAHIEEHLGDPHLSPDTIAAAHHISKRYLYKLFEGRPYGVADWIRHRRLELCRRDLTDPAHAQRPVGAIAARWGLTDPQHFNRAFRAAYGVPPGRFRRLCVSPA